MQAQAGRQVLQVQAPAEGEDAVVHGRQAVAGPQEGGAAEESFIPSFDFEGVLKSS